MDRFINGLAKLDIFKSDFDYYLIRASMVFIAFFFGYQKWFQYEADALIPYISHGPPDFLERSGDPEPFSNSLEEKKCKIRPIMCRAARLGNFLEPLSTIAGMV